ncbi:MAG: hypothetical protein HY553_12990 [Elusimicrobia bacterium]|nr:hypothetical protein [Elusimicrobiota bacterium]
MPPPEGETVHEPLSSEALAALHERAFADPAAEPPLAPTPQPLPASLEPAFAAEGAPDPGLLTGYWVRARGAPNPLGDAGSELRFRTPLTDDGCLLHAGMGDLLGVGWPGTGETHGGVRVEDGSARFDVARPLETRGFRFRCRVQDPLRGYRLLCRVASVVATARGVVETPEGYTAYERGSGAARPPAPSGPRPAEPAHVPSPLRARKSSTRFVVAQDVAELDGGASLGWEEAKGVASGIDPDVEVPKGARVTRQGEGENAMLVIRVPQAVQLVGFFRRNLAEKGWTIVEDKPRGGSFGSEPARLAAVKEDRGILVVDFGDGSANISRAPVAAP